MDPRNGSSDDPEPLFVSDEKTRHASSLKSLLDFLGYNSWVQPTLIECCNVLCQEVIFVFQLRGRLVDIIAFFCPDCQWLLQSSSLIETLYTIFLCLCEKAKNKGILKVHRYAIKKVRVQINFQVAA